jgi:hypothetical protein
MSSHQPITTYRYMLTHGDALAFEAGRPLSPMGSVVFAGWLLLAIFETGLIAGGWGEDWGMWAVGAGLVAIHYGIAKAAVALLVRRRAARRIPEPTPMQLEEWGDHIVVRGGGREIVLALNGIAATALTATHLVISAPPEAVIVPNSAFGDPADARALRDRIEAGARDD